jgi:glycosyltransferase involved in cell wall biosynthesis
VLPHPVAVLSGANIFLRSTNKGLFRVLNIFNSASSFARKNPVAAVRAFQKAFDNDQAVCLTIKTSNLSTSETNALAEAIDGCPNINVVDKIMNWMELAALYSTADLYLSLHRAEGFGLTLAEAMLHALPVVATNWSGNEDFLTDKTGIPVPFSLIPARDPQRTYDHPEMMWAEADIDAAAQALQRLRANPTLRTILGAEAGRHAHGAWSAEAYALAVRTYLGI